MRLPRKTTFDTFQNVWMSRSATPATRNEATTRLKHPKRTTSAKLPHRHGHTGIARTVANGCGRLRTVATTNATSSEHTLNPQTPRVKREPLLRILEKHELLQLVFISGNRFINTSECLSRASGPETGHHRVAQRTRGNSSRETKEWMWMPNNAIRSIPDHQCPLLTTSVHDDADDEDDYDYMIMMMMIMVMMLTTTSTMTVLMSMMMVMMKKKKMLMITSIHDSVDEHDDGDDDDDRMIYHGDLPTAIVVHGDVPRIFPCNQRLNTAGTCRIATKPFFLWPQQKLTINCGITHQLWFYNSPTVVL